MCVTVQWHVLLLSVEYPCVSQYSDMFYFHQLNIHVCHSTVACFTFISCIFMCATVQWHVLLLSLEYSCVTVEWHVLLLSVEYSCVTLQWHVLLFRLNIHVCHSIVVCFTFIS